MSEMITKCAVCGKGIVRIPPMTEWVWRHVGNSEHQAAPLHFESPAWKAAERIARDVVVTTARPYDFVMTNGPRIITEEYAAQTAELESLRIELRVIRERCSEAFVLVGKQGTEIERLRSDLSMTRDAIFTLLGVGAEK